MNPPLFCPRCRREEPGHPGAEIGVCPECRVSLAIQGYCPVCEKRWKLPPGKMCPKHDLPLEDQSETVHERSARVVSKWVPAANFSDDTEAKAQRLRLEGEGIPTMLDNERMGSSSMLQVATGGVTLNVPEEFLADARVILSQNWSIPPGPDSLVSDDDSLESEDEWDVVAPGDPSERRRRIMKSIALAMVAPSVIALVVGVAGLVIVLILALTGFFHR